MSEKSVRDGEKFEQLEHVEVRGMTKLLLGTLNMNDWTAYLIIFSSDEYDSEEDEDSHNTLTPRSFENAHPIREQEKSINIYGIGEFQITERSRLLYER